MFEKTDLIPFFPGRARESTIANWKKQGLPKDQEWFSYLTRKLGIDCKWLYADINTGVNFKMIPEFEEKVIERKENTQIVQDWKGNICEISNDFNVSYLRAPIDFVTRRWIKCPVANSDDWEEMKLRYDPDDPHRFTLDFDERCKFLDEQDRVVSCFFMGPFMQLREWLGFENLCIALIEQKDFLKEMISFYADFISILLEKILKKVKLDYVHVSEDMAYKGKAMISTEMVKDFFLPTWEQWGKITHDFGCPIYDIDSDGYIGGLIPIWIEAGFQITDPIEIAAGNNIIQYRKRFGNKIAYLGGIDKRAIAEGGKYIKQEIEKLKPVIKSGGFIPSCDHGIPNNVTWTNMLEYSKLLAKFTGWL